MGNKKKKKKVREALEKWWKQTVYVFLFKHLPSRPHLHLKHIHDRKRRENPFNEQYSVLDISLIMCLSKFLYLCLSIDFKAIAHILKIFCLFKKIAISQSHSMKLVILPTFSLCLVSASHLSHGWLFSALKYV